MRTSSPVRIFRSRASGRIAVAPPVTSAALSLYPETTFTAAVTGTANLLVTVTCRDLAALYAFVTTKVGPLPAVRQVETVPVLHRIKQAGTRVRDGRLSAT